MSRTQRVFVDANVLFSRTLRDWLFMLRLETDSMFQIHSTEDVLVETLYRLRRKHPDWSGGQITRLRDRIVNVLDEIVVDYEVSGTYNGTDPHDRHVHAAAIASHADILLTGDGGFAKLAQSDALPYSVYGCDDFFILIDDSGSRAVQRVVDRQRDHWARQQAGGTSAKPLTEALLAAGCPDFAKRVHGHLRTLSGPTAATHPENSDGRPALPGRI